MATLENNQGKSSAHGGARKGAGRKKGAATAKTREIANRAAEEGVTPLEVMLKAMRQLDSEGDITGAAKIARDAAPYMHPRLAAIDHTTNGKDMQQTSGVLVAPGAVSEEAWEKQANGGA